MQRCTRCVLPETFPGIRFDEEGVCQYCRQMPTREQRAAQKARLRERFEQLVQRVREQAGYHCLVSLSGGKDSTYTLWLLRKRYNLRALAFTFDNCFVSPDTLKNMRLVAENLGVDHVIVKARFDLMQKVILASLQPGMHPPRALGRASSICNSCMAIAKGIALRMALEKGIPLLVYGWSPGQVPLASSLFHTNPRMLRAMISVAKGILEGAGGDEIAVYFPEEHHLKSVEESPFNVSPLAFLDYDEEKILRCIDELAWAWPQDTDSNSTNCLLNGFANLVHLEQMGFHPYVMDLAGLVREGCISRDQALARLEVAAVPEVVAAVEAKLGVHPLQRRGRTR